MRAMFLACLLGLALGCGDSGPEALDAAMGSPDGGDRDGGDSDGGDRGDAGRNDGGSTEALPGPVVLVPAFHATTTNDWSLESVAEVLRAEGHYVHLAEIPPYASTPDRAAALLPQLDQVRRDACAELRPDDLDGCFEAMRVHLVGHSQGGLDARYAVSNLGFGAHAWSVVALSSPHRGTPLGDVGLVALGDERAEDGFAAATTQAARELLEDLVGTEVWPEGLADGLYWLSEARFRAQEAGAEEVSPDVPGVRYLSFAGVATTDGDLPDVTACDGLGVFPTGRAAELRDLHDNTIFTAVRLAFDDEHDPNDGHIPVASAKYGEFLGCVPADHLDLVGRPDDQVDENIELAGWDYQAFHRELAGTLRDIEADR